MADDDRPLTTSRDPILLDYPTRDVFVHRDPWKLAIRIFQILVVFGIFTFGLLGLTCVFFGELIFDGPTKTPEEYFQHNASMIFPDNGVIVHHFRQRNSFNGDGEFVCIFDLDEDGINRLLDQRIWGQEWVAGQPLEIVRSHFSDEQFKNDAIWQRKDIRHLAQNRSPNNDFLPWHNGRIFIIDTQARRVWFGDWDF